jgi:hypothetical protein
MNKMWTNFQDMFTQAHETYESLTEQVGGYQGANMAQAGYYNAAINTQSDSFYTEKDDAFAKPAMAAMADKDLLTTLT